MPSPDPRVVQQIHKKVQRRAAQEFKHRFPEEYDRMMNEEYKAKGVQRNPVGRPPITGQWSYTHWADL